MIGLLALLAPLALAPQGEPARTLDTVHLFEPPARLEAWKQRRFDLNVQVLLAAGLWPEPTHTFPEPVIRAPIDRDGYTVSKIWFESLPGHVVTGNLYEPKGEVKAGVLSPHGHWEQGRFCELEDEQGNDRWPIQARCAQLARMGCVVLQYDMVGYGESTAIPHEAFNDADAILDGASLLGLQLGNSLCALNVLQAMPGVRRIGVTGASGGGTQTFLLCAVSDRIDAAFPAVMVSNRMQGGCACENAPYLRLGTDNVELAALFAPRPLALSGANDWTVAIETEGLPELKRVWGLYGAEDKVTARCWPELPHNFGHESRAMMVQWFNEHLELGIEGEIVEAPIVPLTREELSVFDAEHPRPVNEGGAEAVRAWWRARVERLSQPGVSMMGMMDGVLSPVRVLVGAERPQTRTEGIAIFVTGPDGDPEYERVVARLRELSPFEVRRISPPEQPAPRDEGRHATYAGYSWCYNPPDVVRRARRIAAEVASWDHARLLAVGPEARAAALAIPGQAFLGGKLQRAVLASSDWYEPRTDLDDRDFLPGEREFRGMTALLMSSQSFEDGPRQLGAREPSILRPRIALVGAGAVPGSLRVLDGRDRPEELGAPHDLDHAREEDFVVRHAELDDGLLRWLCEP